MNMDLKPIGVIHTPFAEARQAPIQPSMAGGAEGRVTIDPEYTAALADVGGFDRIWLLYWFDRAAPAKLTVTPYLDEQERGLFATRAPVRPNPIGLSSVRLLAVDGCDLHVADVDMLDGTPLLDIKPYVPHFDCYPGGRCGWLEGKPLDGDRQVRADDRFTGQPGPAPDG